MPLRSIPVTLFALTLALATAATAHARLPRDFFGIAPQTPLELADTKRMRHGGLEVIRVPVNWGAIQSSPDSPYDWSGLDSTMALAARSRLSVLPFISGAPRWLVGREIRMPVSNARQRRTWMAFVRAAAERYGSRGDFWREHSPTSGDFVPRRPVKAWQIWNEPNFFYFAKPVSPGRYARLLKAADRALARGDRRADVVIGGLFGDPGQRPPRAMDATDFLQRLYAVRGIKRAFDGIALHPYAANAGVLRRLTEQLRQVALRNRDRRAGLYVTEMGWGSQRNPQQVSFEVGRREQARELRRSYVYLIRNRGRLNLKQVHWFSWKDARYCDFCDSVGLFREGPRFKPKPAWHALVAVARGRLR